METEKPKHFWEYRTIPPSNKDLFLRILLEPICRTYIGASKPTHTWNWQRQPYPDNFEGNFVPGDQSASFPSHLGILGFVLVESKWGWQKMRSIKPDLEKFGDERNLEWWQYCWSPADRSFLERCNIAIKPHAAIRLMVGPNSMLIHGYGSDNLEVPLIVSEQFSRKDPKYSHLTIF